MARIYKALCEDLKRFKGEYYDEMDDVRDFADFSDLYRFLRKLLFILLTVVLIYLGL